MYSYLFEVVGTALYNINWVLALVVMIVLPLLLSFVGLCLAVFNGKEGNKSLVPFILLPLMALLEGISYALVTSGASVAASHALSRLSPYAEVFCAVVTIVMAVRKGYKQPALYTIGTFLAGYAPFVVMAIVGGVVFLLQFVGLLIVVIAAVIMLERA